MQPTLVSTQVLHEGWVFEEKVDGYRMPERGDHWPAVHVGSIRLRVEHSGQSATSHGRTERLGRVSTGL